MVVRRTVLILAFILPIAPAGGAPKPQAWIDGRTGARIDRLFANFKHPGTPGFALLLIRNGKAQFSRHYGDANLENRVPITDHTAFHLASLSKQFTGAAIALLVLDKKVSLEDPVSKYIPEAMKLPGSLQVKHLVYMTSGLPEYFTLPRKSHLPWYTGYYFTRDEAIRAVLASKELRFKPGTKYEYSNTNYMLLTRIVEKISGQPFSVFMRTRVFQRLDMQETEVNDDSTQVIPNRALGYAPRGARVVDELRTVGIFSRPGPGWILLNRNSPHFGGSGVFSSTDDLAKWDENWYTAQLAGPAFTATMNRRLRFAFGAHDGIGLGFHRAYGHATINYSGADIDSSTFMERFPAQHFTIICLSNDPLGDAEGKATAVLSILHQAGKL